MARLKGQKMVCCRLCKGDHWTTKCPHKDSLVPLQESLDADKKKEEPAPSTTQQTAAGGPRPGKYVPPSLREGGNRKGESMSLKNRGWFTVCVKSFMLTCPLFRGFREAKCKTWMAVLSQYLSNTVH